MVKAFLLAMALSAQALHSAEASALTPTAQADSSPQFEKNRPVEDFFTVSLISTPFTALWSFVGASIVAGISQGKFPPEYNDQMLIGAGGVALGASLSIGLVSAYWGKGVTPARHDGVHVPLPRPKPSSAQAAISSGQTPADASKTKLVTPTLGKP